MAKARFINSVVKTARTDTPKMPWARGTRRVAFVAKRNQTVPLCKTA